MHDRVTLLVPCDVASSFDTITFSWEDAIAFDEFRPIDAIVSARIRINRFYFQLNFTRNPFLCIVEIRRA